MFTFIHTVVSCETAARDRSRAEAILYSYICQFSSDK